MSRHMSTFWQDQWPKYSTRYATVVLGELATFIQHQQKLHTNSHFLNAFGCEVKD